MLRSGALDSFNGKLTRHIGCPVLLITLPVLYGNPMYVKSFTKLIGGVNHPISEESASYRG